MAVKAIPDGYHSVTPYLIVRGAKKALEFYTKAFGAEVLYSMDAPDGTVGHAEVRIGNSLIMLGEESPQMGAKSADAFGGSPVGLCLYVENVDKVFTQALAAGAKEERPLKNQFYGDRSGTLRDPFGLQWTVSTRIEDVSPAEMERRMHEAMKQG